MKYTKVLLVDSNTFDDDPQLSTDMVCVDVQTFDSLPPDVELDVGAQIFTDFQTLLRHSHTILTHSIMRYVSVEVNPNPAILLQLLIMSIKTGIGFDCARSAKSMVKIHFGGELRPLSVEILQMFTDSALQNEREIPEVLLVEPHRVDGVYCAQYQRQIRELIADRDDILRELEEAKTSGLSRERLVNAVKSHRLGSKAMPLVRKVRDALRQRIAG